MSETLEILQQIMITIITLISLITFFVKPIRERIFGIQKEKKKKEYEDNCRNETDRCLLRNHILGIYYKHCNAREVRQYEFENVGLMYAQYKRLGGNSFVDKIWADIQSWNVIK